MQIKIALADDHKAITDGLELLLQSDGNINICGIFNDGNPLVDFLKSTHVDVVVSDIGMPGFSGLKLLREIKKIQPQCKVIFLSMHNEAELIKEYFIHGLWAYVLKDSGHQELIKAIQSALTSSPYNCQKTEKLISSNSVLVSNKAKLTNREMQIIKLLAKNYKVKEIANQLFVESSTVETHKKNIFKKLKLNSTVSLVKYAYDYNIVN